MPLNRDIFSPITIFLKAKRTILTNHTWQEQKGIIFLSRYGISLIDRLSENAKSENFGIDIKGFMTRKSAKIPILGQPVHYLYLLTDTCISLAEMIIKHKNLRVPQSYQEAFDILGENGILELDFAYSFAKIAGFRNLLAHDYERIDANFICEGALSKLGDIDKFIMQIESSLTK